MRVYLDNCCYNRPFDDQTPVDVRLEAAAKLAVQFLMWTGRVEFAWSDVLDYEISKNPHLDRAEMIWPWRERATEIVYVDDPVIGRGEEIRRCGVKEIDALHIACAERARCDWLLTTDKGILKKIQASDAMRIANPVQFITEGYKWKR